MFEFIKLAIIKMFSKFFKVELNSEDCEEQKSFDEFLDAAKALMLPVVKQSGLA